MAARAHAMDQVLSRPGDVTLSPTRTAQDGSVTYAGLGDGVTFLTEPLEQETEITGPIAAKLWVSSATEDADLFWWCGCSRPT